MQQDTAKKFYMQDDGSWSSPDGPDHMYPAGPPPPRCGFIQAPQGQFSIADQPAQSPPDMANNLVAAATRQDQEE